MAISLGTISQAIGDSTDMSRSENINPWSRRKFVRHASRSKLTDSQMADMNYGWEIPVMTRSLLFGATLPSQRVWKYLAPRSGVDPSRMGDMEGYYHYAMKKNIRLIPPYSNNEMYLDQTFSFGLETETVGVESTNGLKIADLKPSGTSYTGPIIGLKLVLIFFEHNSNGYDYARYVVNTGWTVREVIERGSIKIYDSLPFAHNSKYTIAAFACTDVTSMNTEALYEITDYSPNMGYLIPLSMNENEMSKSEVTITFLREMPVEPPIDDFRMWQTRIVGKNTSLWTINYPYFILLANNLEVSKYNMKIILRDDRGNSEERIVLSEWSEDLANKYADYDYYCSDLYCTFTPFSGFSYQDDTLFVDLYIESKEGSGKWAKLAENVSIKFYEDE